MQFSLIILERITMTMRWTVDVDCMAEVRNAYKISARKSVAMRQLGCFRLKLEANIRIYLKYGCERMDWMYLAQDNAKRQALV